MDTTSASLITTSIAIVTVLIALGTFLISKIEPKESIFYWTLIVLGIGIALATTSIIFLMKSRTVRPYRSPISPHNFFKDLKLDVELTENYMKARKAEFIRVMIVEYLNSIRNYNYVHEVRTRMIWIGQRFLYPAILSIAVLVLLILTTYGLRIITLKF